MKRNFFRVSTRVDFVCLLFGFLIILHGWESHGSPAPYREILAQSCCQSTCFAWFVPDNQWATAHPSCVGTPDLDDCNAAPALRIDGSNCVPPAGTSFLGHILVNDDDGLRHVYGAYAKDGSIEILLIEAERKVGNKAGD